jgi:Cdc6-like AAA superfamily ATPase
VSDTGGPESRLQLEKAVNAAFSPHQPINQAKLFQGRTQQMRAVTDAVQIPGLHVAIYGERGVGKTSLANMIGDLLPGVVVSRVNCSEQEAFASVMRRALKGLAFQTSRLEPGFGERKGRERILASDYLPEASDRDRENVTADALAGILSSLPGNVVLIVDEFDRIGPFEAVHFADFIKALSDRGAATTVVLVGVAEDLNALIGEHASVERCLRQIKLQRMSDDELGGIVESGLRAAGLRLSSALPLRWILQVSQGLPHYTHLLAQNAARAAIDAGRLEVTEDDVLDGSMRAAEEADQSHRELYHRAITGTKKRTLWKEVVTACAIADRDDRGYFSSGDVQRSMSWLLGRPILQQTLAYHLGKLTEQSRGPLLERIGPERRYRYRFLRPFMPPFIIMKAMNDGLMQPASNRPARSDEQPPTPSDPDAAA